MTGHMVAMGAQDVTLPVRARLLQAGVAVFSRSGFNGSSVQDITEAAGVPKGSFYNHFDSKETLGVAAIQHYWSESSARSLAILAQNGLEPLLRLRRYFEQVEAEIQVKDYTCGCFIGNMAAELSDHSSAVSRQLDAIYAEWTGRVAGCIRQAQESGAVRSIADPLVLAAFALNAWEGALLRARVAKSPAPLRQFVDTLFTQLLC